MVKPKLAVALSMLFIRNATVRADVISFGSGANQFNVVVTIGNPGNAADIVWEWEETELDLVNDVGSSVRGLRGGSWLLNFGPPSAWPRRNATSASTRRPSSTT